MTTIRLHLRSGTDGKVLLELPPEFADTDLEIVVRSQSDDPAVALGYPAGFFERTWGSLADENEWPVGFFEETAGSLADDPVERPSQPDLPS